MSPRSHLPFRFQDQGVPETPPVLTARQQQILDWIRGHLEASGRPPTRAEIATGLGFSTPSSAEDHLRALEKKGVLEIQAGASRGLRLKDVPGVPVQGLLPRREHGRRFRNALILEAERQVGTGGHRYTV